VIKVIRLRCTSFVSALTGDNNSSQASTGTRRPHGDHPQFEFVDDHHPTTVPSLPDIEHRCAVDSITGQITVDVRNASRQRVWPASWRIALSGRGSSADHRGYRRADRIGGAVRRREQYSAQLVANSLNQRLPVEPDLSLPAGHSG